MLELQNITFSANEGGRKLIIDDISLSIDERFVAFTGPNGGGKSTLAKLIMGLYRCSSGRIIFNGTDITNASVTERARLGIGYAFQQPVHFKGITVNDLINIASGNKLTVSQVCEYLSEVGLCARDYVDREINSSLSGGELKRIEIAVAIARNSALAIFDEPEAGIDLWSFNNLISVFEKMCQRTKGSILIISHQEHILSIADRIIVIADGKVTKDGSREAVLPELLTQRACVRLTDKL